MVVRQAGDDVLSDALREIFLFRVSAHICKGQHRDRRLLRQWSCRSGRRERCSDRLSGLRFKPNAMGRNWPGDILDLLIAHVLERRIELIANLIAHDAADADSPWLRHSLQARRDVAAVAINVPVVDDDAADVETNAKLDAPFWGDLGVALNHLPLDIDGTTYGVDDTGKFNKDAAASCLDDAPAVFGNLGIDDGSSVALECGQRSFFIQAHQPRIARDIPRENGREAALDPFSAQDAPPNPADKSCASRGWPHVVCQGGLNGSTAEGFGAKRSWM